MHKTAKMLLIPLAAAATLSLAVASASANRLQVDEQLFEMVYDDMVFLGIIDCPVTFLGEFRSRTILKEEMLLGRITHLDVDEAECDGGTVIPLMETLPWHLTYDSYQGSLPNITGLRTLIVGLAFAIEIILARCLAASTGESPAAVIAGLSGGRSTVLTLDPTVSIPVTGGGLCPESGNLEGEGVLTNLTGTQLLGFLLI